jgi:hypothetical protein
MKSKLSLAFALALLLVSACNGTKEEPTPSPTPSPTPTPTVKTPVIQAQAFGVPAQAGTVTLPVTVENPAEGKTLSARLEETSDWITVGMATSAGIALTVTENLSAAREVKVVLSYPNASDVTVVVTQAQWDYPEFVLTETGIGPFGITMKVQRKAGYSGGYFFEVLDKPDFDKYVKDDPNKLGEFAYGEALYQSDLNYLNNLAAQHGHPLSDLFAMLPGMYSADSEVTMPYSGLDTDADYVFLVYGIDSSNGARKTPICVYQFHTHFSSASSLTFTGHADAAETYAEVTVTPSNDTEYWYMDWISEIDLETSSFTEVMRKSINNAKSLLSKYKPEQILCHGEETLSATSLMPGTKYYVVAWGMDLDMQATTAPAEVFTFTTKDYTITDDCTFSIDILKVEQMDVQIRVTPTNLSTRYYVAFVEESKTVGYSDEQIAQRIINMEAQRIDQHYYDVEDLSWATLPGLLPGVREIWGRKDEGWTFLPDHNYHIYVFGIDNFGIRSTAVARKDVTTSSASSSSNTFVLTQNKVSWQGIDFTVTPSNSDYWTYFVIETSELDAYRVGGLLDEDAIMHEIEEYYEHNGENILYYTFNKEKQLYTHVTPETMYSILVFGYEGSNTTPMYETQIYAPAPPFNTSSADYSYTYELFRGEDLSALDPVQFPLVDFEGDCVMVLKLSPNAEAAHWCLGLWPPKENFRESGGKYHLMTLDLDTTAAGSAMQDKKFFRSRPWWYGCGNGSATNKEPWQDDEGHLMNYYPWTISGWAEDANGNYGPWHYDYFIPIPVPKDDPSLGPYEVGYTEAYPFWNESSSVQVYSVRTGKPVSMKK